MSEKHLAAGSVEPPRVEGQLRLYSTKYCPYAERVRLVLKAKNLKHDIVNINLIRKPDWYLKINPKGQVPTLLDGDKIITESLDISDYLDEKYPNQVPLYPSDPVAKAKEKEVIRNFVSAATGAMGKIVYTKELRTPKEGFEAIFPPVQKLTEELLARGTTFYGGESPGMVDYMLWPWVERTRLISLTLGEKLPVKDADVFDLKEWKKAMLEVPVVKETVLPTENHWAIAQAKAKGEEPNYDL
ncbi:pyrimidodiazepine synthase-like [Sitophilus oryzae]|uniref:Pyrimidodiazepine synthase-like n=1 Tax=Sitophilus oryzae TaxID=7048 RepID=A0A6J2YNT9_SITOR|nr:pyrimidodiazepine synthase-like [Sitophilus oryzae]